MRKSYSILLVMILLISPNLFSQSVAFDKTTFQLVNSNFAVRLASEYAMQDQAKGIKDNLDKVNQNYAKLILAKATVEDALCNVNSALKNSLAIKEIGTIVTDIFSNSQKLLALGARYPHYSHITKVYMENAVMQALSLEKEIAEIALKGKEKNIVMNYNYRDQIVRDVFIRLRLINSNLQLACRSIEGAVSVGFLKGATPFGQWISNDRMIVEQIISQAKHM